MSRVWFRLVSLSIATIAFATLAWANSGTAKPAIVVMGDSLSAGYGVDVGSSWVALLERRLAAQGYGYRVVNASVSGETTGGGRSRLPRTLKVQQPAIVILELGANDGLRGLPLAQMRANLEAMIKASRDAGAKVMLIGMRMPPNYGDAYAEGFHALFGELAKQYGMPTVDFFLEGVALDRSLMQDDGMHPNAKGQPRLLENVWPVLKPMLGKPLVEKQ